MQMLVNCVVTTALLLHRAAASCQPNVLLYFDENSAVAWDSACVSQRQFQVLRPSASASALQLASLNLVAVTSYPSVESLLLSHNFLGAFKPKFADPALKNLDLSWNSVASVSNLSLPPALATLDLSHNSIVSLENNASWPPGLTALNLAFNPIQSIGSNVWSNASSLANLSLAGIDMTTSSINLTTIGFPSSLDALNLSQMGLTLSQRLPALSSLHSLDLSGNKLTAVPTKLPASLTTLSLSSNVLDNLEGLETLTNLKSLNIRGNPIKELRVSSAVYTILSGLNDLLVSKETLAPDCTDPKATKKTVHNVVVCVTSASSRNASSSGNKEDATPATPDATTTPSAGGQGWSKTTVAALALTCFVVGLIAAVMIVRKREAKASAHSLEWPPTTSTPNHSKTPANAFARTVAPTTQSADRDTDESWLYSSCDTKTHVPILEDQEETAGSRQRRVPKKLADLTVFEIPLEEVRVTRMLSSGRSEHKLLYLTEYQGYETVLYVTLARKLPAHRRESRVFVEQVRLAANLEHLSLVQFIGVLFGGSHAGTLEGVPKWKLGALMEYMQLGSLETLFAEERNRRDGKQFMNCPSTLDALAPQRVRGDLFSWLPKPANLGSSEREEGEWRCKLSIALDVAMALVYLHSVNVVHGQLCAAHVFINEQGEAKLNAMDIDLKTNVALRASAAVVDETSNVSKQSAASSRRGMRIFGTSSSITTSVDLGSSLMGIDPRGNSKTPTIARSSSRSSTRPSSRLSTPATRRFRAQMGDVYAFGVLLWELDTMMSMATMQRQLSSVLEPGKQHNMLKFSSSCPPEIQRLAHRCWHGDIRKRPSAMDIQEELVQLLESKLAFAGDRSAASTHRWSQRTRPSNTPSSASSDVLLSESSWSLGTVPSETEV